MTTLTTLTNTDLLELLKTTFTVEELSVDPQTFTDGFEDQTLSDEYLSIKIDGNVFNIGFDVSVELNVVNSGGDGYNDDNFDYVDGMEIDVNITDIESVDTLDTFDLKSDNLGSLLESLVSDEIDSNL